MSMFPVVHPKTAMRDAFFIFNFIDLKTAMRNLLSTEEEDIHTKTII